MPNDKRPWIDVDRAKRELRSFFSDSKPQFELFGRTINQVFEAFVFAQTIQWYRDSGWTIEIINPLIVTRKNGKPKIDQHPLRLKYSTRGRPDNYSYARCSKGTECVQIRHQLRSQTAFATYRLRNGHTDPRCNVCLDIAIIENIDLLHYKTDHSIPNANLISFGEAKHMSGFAELIASFVGLVHELAPHRLQFIRTNAYRKPAHPPPFLFVSGVLYNSGESITNSLIRRKYDIDVYTRATILSENFGTDILKNGKPQYTIKSTPDDDLGF